MLTVVFDTVVFVRGLISPYGPCGRLVFARSSEYQLVVSAQIVAEYVDVLNRPQLAHKFKRVEGISRRRVLEIVSQARSVEVKMVSPVSRDPGDDKFLATAVAAGVDYIVSADEDLLTLQTIGGTRIVDCLEFGRILEASSSDPAD